MAKKQQNSSCGLHFDEIGYWSEIKLEIVKEYAKAYSTILTKNQFKYFYIDGFAGPGVHLTKNSKQFVPGSPVNALNISPPFHGYFLIDLDGDKVEQLRTLTNNRRDVQIIHGDCNKVLLGEVFPKTKYEDYRRALCVLDPYGLHLNWEVIQTAGRMKSIDLFLNFPIFDMNRNALWRKPQLLCEEDLLRMNAFWGDDSWRLAAYRKQQQLFGEPDEDVKLGNRAIVDAFCKRLKSVAGFKYNAEPMPMRNSKNAIVYYLFFSSNKSVAVEIAGHIFDKYRDRRG